MKGQQDYKVRHPRLEAYYKSVMMNFAEMGIALCLLILKFSDSLLPFIGMGVFGMVMIVYSLWFWTGKKKSIATDNFLSDIVFPYFLYCIIISNLDKPSDLWLYFGLLAAIAAGITYIVRLDREAKLKSGQEPADRPDADFRQKDV